MKQYNTIFEVLKVARRHIFDFFAFLFLSFIFIPAPWLEQRKKIASHFSCHLKSDLFQLLIYSQFILKCIILLYRTFVKGPNMLKQFIADNIIFETDFHAKAYQYVFNNRTIRKFTQKHDFCRTH